MSTQDTQEQAFPPIMGAESALPPQVPQMGATPQSVRFPGQSVRVGHMTLVIPPLSFKQIRSLEADIKRMGAGKVSIEDAQEKFESLLRIIHTAISRNYPTMTLSQIEEIIDLGNIQDVIGAVMAVSGFTMKLPGAGGAGEGDPPLTGMSSTLTSS